MEPTPDLEQLQAIAEGPAPDPDLLMAWSTDIAARRSAAREQADIEGKRLRAIIPMLYRAGETDQTALARRLECGRPTVIQALDAAGIKAAPRVERIDTARSEAA